MKPNILFLCTGNSCRSQMAEGWAKHYHSDKANFYSAGIEKHGLNPWALQVMKNHNVDISHHNSNSLDEFTDIQFDLVVTICGHADETCPAWPAKTKVLHQPFDDPPRLAQGLKDEEEILSVYNKVCTEIEKFVKGFQF